MSYAPSRSELIIEQDELQPNETVTVQSTFFRTPGRRGLPRTPARLKTKQPRRPDYPIIVHSHLCWDWVWQRPQQFVSRLSRRHPVLFVETLCPHPQLACPTATFRALEEYPNITLLRVQFPTWLWNNGPAVDSERRRILRRFISGPVKGRFDHAVQWFYDPMAVTAFGGKMGEILTVYDCMDELSKFRFAPPEITRREAELLARAHVVFTGGRHLFEAKSRHHPNCHFYGCGVDAVHFGLALKSDTAPPPDLGQLPKPVLGYFGVIDERLDYDLLASLAEAFPHGSVAMVGPVLKVDESALPRRPNIHWLGQRPYEDLPAICKAFDVCLMPFAMNEATEFINPTKTLEYMATGRPVVSTPIADVVRGFSHIVSIADSTPAFIEACRLALDAPNPERICTGLQTAADHSWDSIVTKLEQHMNEALLANSSG